MVKKIRNLELRTAYERLSLVANSITPYSLAAEYAEKFHPKDIYSSPAPIPFLGFSAALNAQQNIQGPNDGPLPVLDTLSIVEAWLVHRWLHTPVLYAPHPALYRALLESDPPNMIDPRVLHRLHNHTWAILVPVSEAKRWPFRILIGSICKAALSSAKGDVADSISTLAVAPQASGVFPEGPFNINEMSTVSFADADKIREVYEPGNEEQKHFQRAIINAGLYLASASPDIAVEWDPKARKAIEQAQKRPRVVRMGDRIGPRLGSVLRMSTPAAAHQEHQGGTHASPVAHYRRGHWRMQWVGSRKGGKKGTHQLPVWIEPMIIGEGEPSPVQRPLR